VFKEKLKKISTRVFYVFFAVVVSIALWLYVEITENEIQTREIGNIEIVFKNEDILHDRGLLKTSYMPETLSFTIMAPRSDINRLAEPGALTVEVDLANISSGGTHFLAYEINLPQGVSRNILENIFTSVSRITITFDRLLSRQIPVKVNYTGGTASNEFMVEAVEFDPHFITVWGPETAVSRIDHIWVPIFRESLSTTFADDLEFILIDENDQVLDDDLRESLRFSQETIWVTVPIKEIKDVPLVVMLSHGSSTSDANTQWHIEPVTVKVSGDPDAIRELNSITLGTIDMLSIGLSDTRALPIVIPNHFINESGESVALVQINTFGLEIAFRSTSNLQVINVPTGFTAEIMTQSLDIRLRGTREELAQITSMNLSVVADLTDMSPGNARVPVRVYIHGIDANIDAVGDYEITVSIFADLS